MECHDCPHAAEIAAGAFADVPWEETPCAECLRAGRSGAACLTSGKRHVFLDEARTAAPEPADGPGDTLMPVSVLADALGALLRCCGEDAGGGASPVSGGELSRDRGAARDGSFGVFDACRAGVGRSSGADGTDAADERPRPEACGGRAEGERRGAARRGPSAGSRGVTRSASAGSGHNAGYVQRRGVCADRASNNRSIMR